METAHITTRFERLSDANLDILARRVIASLTANEYFSDPQPPLQAVLEQQQRFAQLLVPAKDGSRLAASQKNDARQLLVDMLKELGRYVQYAGKGKKSILLSSGFELAKEPAGHIELEQPADIQIEGSARGEISISLGRCKGARSYIYQLAPDPLAPDSRWESAPSTRRGHTFAGLASGQRYWLRVVAVGTNEQSIASEAHAWVAQ